MLRLPWFEHRAPRSVAEAAKILAGEGTRAMLIAGGTDLLPNMKRRHQAPQVLVSLRQVSELRQLNGTFGAWWRRFMFGSRSVPPAIAIAAGPSPARIFAASATVRGAR